MAMTMPIPMNIQVLIPFFNPFNLLRAHVLTDKRRDRQHEAVDRQAEEIIKLVRRAETGDCRRTKPVDIRHDEHIGERNDHLLQTAGNPQPHDLHQHRLIDPDFFGII